LNRLQQRVSLCSFRCHFLYLPLAFCSRQLLAFLPLSLKPFFLFILMLLSLLYLFADLRHLGFSLMDIKSRNLIVLVFELL
jgi:hypothetical protein